MKPFSKTANKWVLSTLMIAALGSQYYFSVSSNSYGKFELSSTKAEELDEKTKQVDSDKTLKPEEREKRKQALYVEYMPLIKAENKDIKDAKVIKAAPATVQPPAPAQKVETTSASQKIELELVKKEVAATVVAAPKKSDTEAKTFKVECPECAEGYVIISKATEEMAIRFSKMVNEKPTVAATPAVEAKPVVAKVETQEDECADEETATARARCKRLKIKEEKEEKKRLAQEAKEEKKQAKLDKEKEKKDERNDIFTEKAEAIADRCKDDLTCKTSALTSLMESYKGTRSVDKSTVMIAYNKLIASDLKAAMNSSDPEVLEAINNLMSSVPSEYKDVKKRAIESIKAGQISKAESVNAMFKEAEVLKGQRKYAEEATVRGQALTAQSVFSQESSSTLSTIYSGLQEGNDKTTYDWVVKTYAPDIRNIIGRLSNLSGIAPDSSSTISSSGSGNRAGRTGNNSVNINNGGAFMNGSTNSSNTLQGVNFGSPSTSRTVNRTGVNFRNNGN